MFSGNTWLGFLQLSVIASRSFENTTIHACRQGMMPLVCCGKPKRMGGGQKGHEFVTMDLLSYLPPPPGWRSQIWRGMGFMETTCAYTGSARQVGRYVRHSTSIHTANMQALCNAYPGAPGGRSRHAPPSTPPPRSLIQKLGTALIITRVGARFFFSLSVCLGTGGTRARAGRSPASLEDETRGNF